MKRLASIFGFILAIMSAGDVAATDHSAIAIEGTYLLIQDDKFQRILSLDRGGNVFQVSNQQPSIGFTSGQEVWRQTGPNSVTARVIDFAYELEGGKPIGPALLVYHLAFTESVAGRYQKVSGSFSGEVFGTGQNALNPTAPPIRTFGIGFKGQRVTVE